MNDQKATLDGLEKMKDLLLDTAEKLRSGEMDVYRGMAIAATGRTYNDSAQVSLNISKAILTLRGSAVETQAIGIAVVPAIASR